jgi:hypothetical protein
LWIGHGAESGAAGALSARKNVAAWALFLLLLLLILIFPGEKGRKGGLRLRV